MHTQYVRICLMLFLLSVLKKYSLCWAFFSSSEMFTLQDRLSCMWTPRKLKSATLSTLHSTNVKCNKCTLYAVLVDCDGTEHCPASMSKSVPTPFSNSSAAAW